MIDWLSPKEAAEVAERSGLAGKFTAEWFRLQLKAGRLRGSKVGGRWLIDPTAIDDMVEAGSNSTARRRRRRAS